MERSGRRRGGGGDGELTEVEEEEANSSVGWENDGSPKKQFRLVVVAAVVGKQKLMRCPDGFGVLGMEGLGKFGWDLFAALVRPIRARRSTMATRVLDTSWPASPRTHSTQGYLHRHLNIKGLC